MLEKLQNLSYKSFNKQLFGDMIKRLWCALFSSMVVILFTLYCQTKLPKINNWMVSAINISYPKSTSQIPFFKAPLIYAKLATCPKTRSFTIHSGGTSLYTLTHSYFIMLSTVKTVFLALGEYQNFKTKLLQLFWQVLTEVLIWTLASIYFFSVNLRESH